MIDIIDNVKAHSPTDFFTAALTARLYPAVDARKGIVKRALAKSHLIRIRKGLYVLSEAHRRKAIHPYEISRLIYGPSYISFESALSFHGLIPETVKAITCASFKRGVEFRTPLGVFRYRRIPSTPFFDGIVRYETEGGGAFLIASPEKALCDLVFERRLKWSSIELLTEGFRIDETSLLNLDLNAALKLAHLMKGALVVNFVESLKKALKNVS